MAVQIENQAIRQMLVEQIAYVEGRTEGDIRSKIDAGAGDLEIDSKLGQTAAVRVAVLLDMEDLIRPEDQKRKKIQESKADAEEKIRDQQNGVRALAILIPPIGLPAATIENNTGLNIANPVASTRISGTARSGSRMTV